MNGPKEKRAASLTASGPSHETSDNVDSGSVNKLAIFQRGVRINGRDIAPRDEEGNLVPLVDGWRETAFDVEPSEILAHLEPRERTTYELRVAALRYVAGIEHRSFREIGAELGVGRAAVSRVFREVLARIGARGIFDNAEKRWKLAEAAKRTLNSQRKAA